MRVLLLGGCGPLNLKVVYCLARMPATTTHAVVTSASNIVSKSRHVASVDVHAGISSPVASATAIDWLNVRCETLSIDAVVPGDMGTAGFLACAAPSLEGVAVYPCSNAAALDRIHDKWSFASTLMQLGIATPRTVLLDSADAVEAACDTIGFPMIVKPLSCESSHGVVRIESARELRVHVGGASRYARMPLVAQRYIAGRDIDISVLAERGRVVLALTQQLEPDGSHRFFDDEATRRLADAIVDAFGYHGIAHFDMRIDAATGEVLVLECNPRFWYSMPASTWQGVNFVEAGIRLARGEPAGELPVAREGRYFLPGALLAALRRPWTMRGLTMRNVRGFLQPALDPVPHFVDLYAKWHPVAKEP